MPSPFGFLLRAEPPSRRTGAIVAVAAVALCTLILYPLKEIAPVVSLGVVYLLAVLVVSIVWGAGLGVATAVLSAAAFNFFHLPPVGQLHDPTARATGSRWSRSSSPRRSRARSRRSRARVPATPRSAAARPTSRRRWRGCCCAATDLAEALPTAAARLAQTLAAELGRDRDGGRRRRRAQHRLPAARGHAAAGDAARRRRRLGGEPAPAAGARRAGAGGAAERGARARGAARRGRRDGLAAPRGRRQDGAAARGLPRSALAPDGDLRRGRGGRLATRCARTSARRWRR